MSKVIRVGSSAFFGLYEDFVPSDIDKIEFVDNPQGFDMHCQIRLRGNCIFQWKDCKARELVDYHKTLKDGMLIGKFLVPEVAEYICLTIDQLRELQPLVDNLDDRHKYEKVIYDAYISNDGFYLTDEQRAEAYNIYKAERGIV